MSIGFGKQSAASVPVPPVGEQNFFVDAADDKFKKKLPDTSIVDLEGLASGVTSFNGRNGSVVPASNDYSASQVSFTPAGNIVATNIQNAIAELDAEKTPITHVGEGGVAHALVDNSEAGFMSPAQKVKLDGIESGATANSTDGYLLARQNHTGTQPAATISDFNTAADARVAIGIANHVADSDPHTQYTTNSEAQSISDSRAALAIASHEGAVDPHSQYTTVAEAESAADSRISLQKGAANGIAPLDGAQKIPTSYLPSYVDDVLEYANFAAFPVTGESGKIYIAADTGKTYRWTGSIYVEISSSEVNSVNGFTGIVTLNSSNISENTNLYFTQARVLASLLTGFQVDWNIVTAADTVLQAIQKLAGRSAMSINNVSGNTTVPAGYTWIRQNRTYFSGTTKISIKAGGKIRFIN